MACNGVRRRAIPCPACGIAQPHLLAPVENGVLVARLACDRAAGGCGARYRAAIRLYVSVAIDTATLRPGVLEDEDLPF